MSFLPDAPKEILKLNKCSLPIIKVCGWEIINRAGCFDIVARCSEFFTRLAEDAGE